MVHWHILTGEYPPAPGGVSDYTKVVAHALAAAGDHVDVWTPPSTGGEDDPYPRVQVHHLPDHFGPRALRSLGRHLDALPAPPRILVQYVPHAFGWKALNVPFCLWLRSRRRESMWVMFHEVAFPIHRGQSLARNALGIATRGMAALVARRADRVFISTLAWDPSVRRLCRPTTSIEWLPVPSVIPVVESPSVAAAVRTRYGGGGRPLVGHLGTYGDLTRPLLIDTLRLLVHESDCRFLLIGRGSDDVAANAVRRWPALHGRLHGAGTLPPGDLSAHVSACDVMLQPYPDGVTTRRTSVMAALAHARPTVTTAGPLTEPVWQERCGVVLCPPGDTRALVGAVIGLLADRRRAASLGAEARLAYDAQFDVRHTIGALRSAGADSALRAVS
jgi:glycosyltransferase involved in cell wall biosynthesis